MTTVHEDAELAPRDIVAREIFKQTQAGKRPMLDTRAALGAEVLTRFPAVAEACARAGFDPVENPIPVAVAAHYHMGGVDTDEHGRSSLDRLWVCGEASSTGLHGANRLASNGLLEALVYGKKAAEDIARTLGDIPEAEELTFTFPTGGEDVDEAAVMDLRRTMTTHVGVRRNADGLKQALATIAGLEAAANNETMRNMTATATLIAAAADPRGKPGRALSRRLSRAGSRARPSHQDHAGGRRRHPGRRQGYGMTYATLPDIVLEPIVRNALMEDLGTYGDVTTRAVIPPATTYDAAINAREPGSSRACRSRASPSAWSTPRLKSSRSSRTVTPSRPATRSCVFGARPHRSCRANAWR